MSTNRHSPADWLNRFHLQRLKVLLTAVSIFALSAFVSAAPPLWWTQRSVLNGNPANDNAVINQGQLKHFTRKAVEELNARIPGGAGAELNNLVQSWKDTYLTQNYSPLNPDPADFQAIATGQVKWIARKIHDRLLAARYEDQVPSWLAPNSMTDSQLANIGQLKTVFNFEFTAPDGQIPDWWQKYYFNTTGLNPNSIPGGGTVSYLTHYQNGTDPTSPTTPDPGTGGNGGSGGNEEIPNLSATIEQRSFFAGARFRPGGFPTTTGKLLTGETSYEVWVNSSLNIADAALREFCITTIENRRSFGELGGIVNGITFPENSGDDPGVGWKSKLSYDSSYNFNYYNFYNIDWGVSRSEYRLRLSAPAPPGGYNTTLSLLSVKTLYDPETVAELLTALTRKEVVLTVPEGEIEGPPVATPIDSDLPIQSISSIGAVWIKPDDNMSGVIGDLVDSVNRGGSIKHFVTPKRSAQPDPASPESDVPYVILTAVGVSNNQITPGHEDQLVEWEGGEPVEGAPLKRRVSRSATGKTEVKIRIKGGGPVLSQMNVWVVWAEGSIISTAAPFEILGTNTAGIQAKIKYEFLIQPTSIILDAERPNLSGVKNSPVPNPDKTHVISGSKLGGGANLKWDVSRQIRVSVGNPRLYPLIALSPVAGHLWAGQPAAQAKPEDYPTDPAEGNDDSHPGDENNNPYGNNAKLTSEDAPTTVMLNSTGNDGDTFLQKYHFREFVRLNIGSKWFRVSDQKLWRFHSTVKKIGGQWRENVSILQQNNEGW